MSSLSKVAFISPRYPDGGAVGGAETLLRNLAEHLASQGIEVDFLTTCAKDHHSWENTLPPGSETINGVNIQYFEVDANRDLEVFLSVQDRISRAEKITVADQRAWMANSVHSTPLYDHLRSNGETYNAILTGPYLFGLTFNGAQILPEKTWLVPCLHDEVFAYLDIMHELFHAVKGILFNAQPEKELAERLYGIAPNKGCVVGMGMEPFEVDPSPLLNKHGLTTPYVLYCGRREGLKGTPLLTAYMHAFRERTGKDIKLVFTGSGAIEADPDLLPHIRDLGFVSEEEKQQVMTGASAFIHPSVNESFGIVLLEAFLGRTPALVHGKSDVLRHQCLQSNAGLWFRTYPEFEAMLTRLLEDQELNQAMGEAGRQYVLNEYSWEAIGRKLITALEENSE